MYHSIYHSTEPFRYTWEAMQAYYIARRLMATLYERITFDDHLWKHLCYKLPVSEIMLWHWDIRGITEFDHTSQISQRSRMLMRAAWLRCATNVTQLLRKVTYKSSVLAEPYRRHKAKSALSAVMHHWGICSRLTPVPLRGILKHNTFTDIRWFAIYTKNQIVDDRQHLCVRRINNWPLPSMYVDLICAMTAITTEYRTPPHRMCIPFVKEWFSLVSDCVIAL